MEDYGGKVCTLYVEKLKQPPIIQQEDERGGGKGELGESEWFGAEQAVAR